MTANYLIHALQQTTMNINTLQQLKNETTRQLV